MLRLTREAITRAELASFGRFYKLCRAGSGDTVADLRGGGRAHG